MQFLERNKLGLHVYQHQTDTTLHRHITSGLHDYNIFTQHFAEVCPLNLRYLVECGPGILCESKQYDEIENRSWFHTDAEGYMQESPLASNRWRRPASNYKNCLKEVISIERIKSRH